MPKNAPKVTLPAPAPLEPLMTKQQAAEYLSVDPGTVRKWILAGRLTGYRVGGGRVRIPRSEVEAMLSPIPTTLQRDQAAGA